VVGTGLVALTAGALYGTFTSYLPECSGACLVSQDDATRQIAFMIGGGVMAILAGMMWLAWTQSADEPPIRAPGLTAVLTGLAEMVGGGLRAAFVPGIEPHRTNQNVSCAIIIGSGIIDLAAGAAWFIWARR
jgi:hypothetical protein